MVIDFSKVNYKEKPVLILRNLDGTAIQTLGYAFNVQGEFSYNEISTLTFDLPEKVRNTLTPHYEDVVGMRIIDLQEIGQFILIDPVEESEDTKTIKSCKAYSLEYEFTKKKLTLENGTYNFWNPLKSEDTIIGRILEKMPDWSVGEIDPTLIGKYRTFEISEENIYDFIKSTIQQEYGCIFEFDTYERKINVVSVDTEIETKPIYLSKERLIKEIEIEEDSDSIITSLDVNGAEGVSIRSVNPTGSNKIYNLDYFMNTTNFSNEFINSWREWEQACESYQSIYYNTTMEYNLKTACKLTKQAALVDLKGELTDLENQQAVTVQAIAQKIETKYTLTEIKELIYDKKDEIADMKSQISDIDEEISELYERLSEINSILAFDSQDENGNYRYFQPDDLIILQKYFIEDSVQDGTFVASNATTYENEDISNSVNSVELTITDGDIEIISDTNGKTLRTITGGTLSIGSLTANIIKASVEFNNDETFILTTYLDNGIVGDVSFESGSVSLIGDYKIITSNGSKLSFMIYNGTLYFTKNTTDYERHEIEWDLYEYGKQVLKDKSYPTYNFSIDSGNFLSVDNFISFKNSLSLGKRLYLKLEDREIIKPYVITAKIDYEDASDLELEFSSSYTTLDKQFSLTKILNRSVSMGKKLNVKSNIYNEFVNSGASTRVKTFMDSALDVAKNTVLSSGKQAIEFGDAGIRVRKWANEEHTAFDDEQIWIVDNMIAFTTDNWSTSNMAIGKIFDGNLGTYVKASSEYDPEKSYYYRIGDREPYTYVHYIYNESDWNSLYPNLYYKSGGYSYGIAAPYLVGTIIAGENLTIDTNNGAFRVDESGVYIDSLKFYITHNGTSYDTTLGEELESLAKATDKVATDMQEAIEEINGEIARTVTTYYQETMPEDAHEGDLWYTTGTSWEYMNRNINEGDTIKGISFNRDLQPECNVAETVIAISNGTTYSSTVEGTLVNDHGEIIYADGVWTELNTGFGGYPLPVVTAAKKDNPFYSAIIGECNTEFAKGKLFRYNGETWNEITDSDIIVAIENAANAQATADKKIVSYYQNYAPYEPTVGDLWYNTATSNKVTRNIEVGDDLSNLVLLFDTNVIINSVDDLKYIIKSDNGSLYAEPNAIVELFGSSTSTTNANSAGVIVSFNSKNSAPVIVYGGTKWNVNSVSVPSTFGVVTSVDKTSAFYNLVTAEFTSNYKPQKLYRYDGYAWVLVEDGEINDIKNEVSTVNKTITSFLTEDKKALNATKLAGVINSVETKMQSAAGNVLFDSDGIWLMNGKSKNTTTQAIWMNENGMLFGKGTATADPANSEDWNWTTAIDHDGIVAEALAGKKISSIELYSSYINAGDGNFVVTKDGSLTAKKGKFSGDVQASDFLDKNGKSMLTSEYKFNSDYLSLKGLEIVDDNGNVTFKINSNGRVTLGYGGIINWDYVNEEDSYAYSRANSAYSNASSAKSTANTANSNISKIANGTYSGGTFISNKEIKSPNIIGGTITGSILQTAEEGAKIKITSSGIIAYDNASQKEGWCLVPDNTYGGVFEYYINGSNCYSFGTGFSGTGYVYTDMTLKAITSNRGRFVVDVTNSSNREVKFVGLFESGNTKYIYANEQLLATQNWVLNDANITAKFG